MPPITFRLLPVSEGFSLCTVEVSFDGGTRYLQIGHMAPEPAPFCGGPGFEALSKDDQHETLEALWKDQGMRVAKRFHGIPANLLAAQRWKQK